MFGRFESTSFDVCIYLIQNALSRYLSNIYLHLCCGLFCFCTQIQDLYISIQLNQVQLVWTNLLLMLRVMCSLRSSHYEKGIFMSMLCLLHQRQHQLPGYDMFKKDPSCLSEEAGEMFLAVLSRMSAKDTHMFDIDHVKSLFFLCNKFLHVSKTFASDFDSWNLPTESNKQVVDRNSDDVIALANHFRKKLNQVKSNKLEVYKSFVPGQKSYNKASDVQKIPLTKCKRVLKMNHDADFDSLIDKVEKYLSQDIRYFNGAQEVLKYGADYERKLNAEVEQADSADSDDSDADSSDGDYGVDFDDDSDSASESDDILPDEDSHEESENDEESERDEEDEAELNAESMEENIKIRESKHKLSTILEHQKRKIEAMSDEIPGLHEPSGLLQSNKNKPTISKKRKQTEDLNPEDFNMIKKEDAAPGHMVVFRFDGMENGQRFGIGVINKVLKDDKDLTTSFKIQWYESDAEFSCYRKAFFRNKPWVQTVDQSEVLVAFKNLDDGGNIPSQERAFISAELEAAEFRNKEGKRVTSGSVRAK